MPHVYDNRAGHWTVTPYYNCTLAKTTEQLYLTITASRDNDEVTGMVRVAISHKVSLFNPIFRQTTRVLLVVQVGASCTRTLIG